MSQPISESKRLALFVCDQLSEAGVSGFVYDLVDLVVSFLRLGPMSAFECLTLYHTLETELGEISKLMRRIEADESQQRMESWLRGGLRWDTVQSPDDSSEHVKLCLKLRPVETMKFDVERILSFAATANLSPRAFTQFLGNHDLLISSEDSKLDLDRSDQLNRVCLSASGIQQLFPPHPIGNDPDEKHEQMLLDSGYSIDDVVLILCYFRTGQLIDKQFFSYADSMKLRVYCIKSRVHDSSRKRALEFSST